MQLMTGRVCRWVLAACLIAVLGCNQNSTPAKSDSVPLKKASALEPTEKPAAAETKPAVADAPADPEDQVPDEAKVVELKTMDKSQVFQLLARQRGKIIVVDYWSTACEPCLRELPHLVALKKKYGKKIACVSVSCDYAGIKNKPVDFYYERVMKVLDEIHAEVIQNVISSLPADELFQELKFDSIPVVQVFDREGNLVRQFDNRTPAGDGDEGISYEKQIEPLIAELIEGTAGEKK